MEVAEKSYKSVSEFDFKSISGIATGQGDTKEEAIEEFLKDVKEIRDRSIFNIELADKLIKELS